MTQAISSNAPFVGRSRGTPSPLVRDYGTIATSQTFQPSIAAVHLLTLGANVTLTFDPSNVPDRTTVRFNLAQDATGTRLVTWVNVVWPAGVAPTLTATASRIDVIEFTFVTSALKWRGVVIAQNYAS